MNTILRPLPPCVWFASFGSIALLISHVAGVATMHALLLPVALPCTVVIITAWLLASSKGDPFLTERLRLGLAGGLWGTVGYDAVRVPLHLMGLNPFPPIRAYGMWVCGFDHATPWTDLAGFTYHISNGITFGWIYALLMTGRHWGWGVLWGLGLEAMAVVTPFGELFGLRAFSQTVIIAFVAHLFYGYPLGRVCQMRATSGLGVSLSWSGTAVIALAAWFVLAWQPVAGYPELSGRVIRLGPAAIFPGVRDVHLPAGADLTLRNETDRELKVRMRSTKEGHHSTGVEIVLPPKGETRHTLPGAGLYQLGVPGEPWRSVWVFAWER
ncbi:MAG: hypothetical protein U1F71_10420 [Verrucomicrobiaceae bacterium]